MALHLKPDRFVAYYRVSTAQQGRSGLGLDAQREAVRVFLDDSAGALAEAFTEVESGKNDDRRPELARALEACRLTGACTVIPTSSQPQPHNDARSDERLMPLASPRINAIRLPRLHRPADRFSPASRWPAEVH